MDDEGNMKKESNARFVRWSDGSFSLHLGAEIFDVYKQPLQVNNILSYWNFQFFGNDSFFLVFCFQ